MRKNENRINRSTYCQINTYDGELFLQAKKMVQLIWYFQKLLPAITKIFVVPMS